VPRPTGTPIGVQLSRTAKTCTRAFDDAMAAAGGSQPVWLILISLKTRQTRNQRELAEAVGIQGATLTHHLNAMEASGLVTRQRDPANRRIHLVTLTAAGELLFRRLRQVAVDFDQRLRAGLSEKDVATLARLLGKLSENVTG
jgi:MarR family transcriptional regulator, transcriptional regulator for hemolysin